MRFLRSNQADSSKEEGQVYRGDFTVTETMLRVAALEATGRLLAARVHSGVDTNVDVDSLAQQATVIFNALMEVAAERHPILKDD